jgi:hypothetical protein
MKNVVRFRFWLEMALALSSAVLTLVTLVWNEWIEIVFGLDPDHGTGATEWLICSLLLVAAMTLFVLARCEWRRMQQEGYQYE